MLNPVLTILVQQIQDTFDRRQTDPIERLGYGNAKLDAMTGGLHDGSLTIVMGPPMSGKTTFIGSLALEIAQNQANEVLFHSFELDARDSGLKWLSDISGVSVSALLSAELEDEDWSRLNYGLGVLHDKRIFLADMPKDWQYVAEHSRKFAEVHPDLRLIVVDNVHSFLALSSRKSFEDELFDALLGMKRLARQLSIPVVASLLTPCADKTKEAATYRWPSPKDTILGVADVVLEIHKVQDDVQEQDQFQVAPGVRVLKNRYSFSEDVDHGFFDRIRMQLSP